MTSTRPTSQEHRARPLELQRPLLLRAVARLVAFVWRWSGDRVGQRPTIGRITAHTGLFIVLALLIVLGSLRLDSPSSLMRMVDATILDGFVQNVDAASSPAEIVERPYDRGQSQVGIARQAQAHTAIPDRPRLEIITYTVQAGDTADKIAASFRPAADHAALVQSGNGEDA